MLEEITGTVPLAILVTGFIVAAVAAEIDREIDKFDAVRFLGIAVRLFNFPNETRLHVPHLHHIIKKHWLKLAQCFESPRKKQEKSDYSH